MTFRVSHGKHVLPSKQHLGRLLKDYSKREAVFDPLDGRHNPCSTLSISI
jgi:hypothetical protein